MSTGSVRRGGRTRKNIVGSYYDIALSVYYLPTYHSTCREKSEHLFLPVWSHALAPYSIRLVNGALSLPCLPCVTFVETSDDGRWLIARLEGSNSNEGHRQNARLVFRCLGYVPNRDSELSVTGISLLDLKAWCWYTRA
ncbi:uncharacterized protein BO96DRAFT_439150 [Aspergillus niger CBS 101883]|uniref:uncharacterized protein n=1 Tax=Aspergillus lacticoffeatus (strain CBS 101883) TaxID=1450533 RepID=UPI000D8044EF|nr:uncharacterized protein BO96DRAFT_439150 [Aspergillus niger CBS 101883]PYH51201.1 hypothetical protein BO96DRAFT_439150 [Aspergillus niger CBS 101883]